MPRKATAKKEAPKGYARFFERRQRVCDCTAKAIKDGCAHRYVTTTDDAPEWLKDAIREVHCSDLPNDWIYEECRGVCQAIDEVRKYTPELSIEDWLDESGEYTDGRVEVYTRELYRWAADMCLSDVWANAESVLEGSYDPPAKECQIHERIAQLQYYAIDAIAHTMANAIREHEESEGEK